MPEMEIPFEQALARMTDLAVTYGLEVIGALAILVAGWIVAGWARRAVRRGLDRVPRVDATLKPLLGSIVRYVVLVLTVIAVLAQFGVQTASIIAMLGAAGLAIGLALQGTLQNIAAGIMLLFLRPFRVGDYIDAEGIAGTVTEVGLFLTEMQTFDGVYRSVPNAQLWSRQILNYSRLPTRRIDHEVGIGYDDDIETAFSVLMDVLTGDERVLTAPPPQVMVMALADSSVNVNMRCWTHRDHYWDLLFDLRRAAKERLDAAGITIPFPQRDVHVQPARASAS